MRVLLVTEASSAGVGRHVIDLAHGLLARGCAVHIAYSRRRIDPLFEQGLLAPELTCHEIDMHRAPHPADALAAWRLGRLIRAHGPFDVVHAHSTKAGALTRMLPRAVLGRARVVYTPHCVYTLNPLLGRAAFLATRAVEQLLARRTDALIAVSPSEEEHLLELGIDRWRVSCIPNGLAPRLWTARSVVRAGLALADDDVAVGFVGRMCEQKDPLLMVRAFARVAHGAPGAVLLMVGSGPLEHAARAEAARLGLERRVRWLGARPATEILPALDVFALTSLYEAMPYVLLEALSCGLPIVSTAVGGANLTVIEGRTGTIARERSPAAFARALTAQLGDPRLRKQASRAARHHALRFTADGMVEATLALYAGSASRPHEHTPVPAPVHRLGEKRNAVR